MNLRDIGLTIAIIVLTIFVGFYGINIFFPSVNYEKFCGNSYPQKLVENQIECEVLNGTWVPQNIECIKAPCPQGYCDAYFNCDKQFNNASEVRSKSIFFVALPLGLVIIIVGMFIFGLEIVGAGLIGGGVGTLIYGAGAYWPYSENWIRFLISLVGLVVLIWLIYYFNRKYSKGKRR